MTPLWPEAVRVLDAAGIRPPELAELCDILSGMGVPPGLAVWREVAKRLNGGSALIEPSARRRREYLVRTVDDAPQLGLALWLLALAVDTGEEGARAAVGLATPT